MNTSKRLELANLIALRLRGINIEDSIAQAADGDGDSDSADATPNTPGMHRNVGRAGAPQSDSDSDDNGADDSAAGAKPRVRALAFQSEKVQSQDSDDHLVTALLGRCRRRFSAAKTTSRQCGLM